MIEKPTSKGAVVNNEFGPVDEGQKLLGNLGEPRLVRQDLVAYPVYCESRRIALPVRAQVLLEMPTAQSPVNQLDAARFR